MTTIYALASGPAPSGVAVIRVSGSAAADVTRALCGRPPPSPRQARLDTFTNNAGVVLDRGLLLWFAAPASFTGEDVAEFHLHGGRAVIASVLAAIAACPDTRLAEPGEFTRRAFENAKLDLTEAEGLADLINAETDAQQTQALRQLQGELGRIFDDWRHRLIALLAHREVGIDFSEEDIPPGLEATVAGQVRDLMGEIQHHLEDDRRGERLREGLWLTIIGAPNAGKSSLLNLLARRDVAIVSEVPGTTRDIIEVHLDLGGYPVLVCDTAGLRHSLDVVESEGVRRALARAKDADLKLAVFDGALWPEVDEATRALIDDDTIVVVNKSDLMADSDKNNVSGKVIDRAGVPKGIPVAIIVSARTGDGIDDLLKAITDRVAARWSPGAAGVITRARHRGALIKTRDALVRSLEATEVELAAEDLRLAVRALGRITGRVDVEDLLDVIFRDFCIGK